MGWIEETIPAAFHGCDIHVVTPIHHSIGIIDPDTGHFRYTS